MIQQAVQKALSSSLPSAIANFTKNLPNQSFNVKDSKVSEDQKATEKPKSPIKRKIDDQEPSCSYAKVPKREKDIGVSYESQNYSSDNESENADSQNHFSDMTGFAFAPNHVSKNLDPFVLECNSLPMHLLKFIDSPCTIKDFKAGHMVPELIQQLVKGLTPNCQDTILQPLMKTEKQMAPLFSDPIFEILQDHMVNDYKINNVPFSVFTPCIKNVIGSNVNLVRIRSSMLSLWNFSAVLPKMMSNVDDSDFNKFVYTFFIPPLINLFQTYQSQVYSLRSLAWPIHLNSLKRRIVRAPLVKGSLWNISDKDVKHISEKFSSRQNQFFRNRPYRRSLGGIRRQSGRSRFRNSFYNRGKFPKRNVEKSGN